jgi:hypothetical protein
MDSRDIIVVGAVAVAAYLYWKNAGGGGALVATLPTAPAGPGVQAMTRSAARTTVGPVKPTMVSQLGPALGSPFGGFSAVNMGPLRFAGATANAVITDAIAPPPVTHPPVQSTPTFVGGNGVFPSGANFMGPQPFPSTFIINPTRY